MEASDTPEAFMLLNPGERLKFAQQLGEAVTPEVVALVVYTYLNTPMTMGRSAYRDALMALIALVDPIELIVLADRYINTSRASLATLAAHREMSTHFAQLISDAGMVASYVRHDQLGYFCGTLGRRVFPANLSDLVAAGMNVQDGVIYRRDDKRFNKATGRHEVEMILVPYNSDLPKTLSL